MFRCRMLKRSRASAQLLLVLEPAPLQVRGSGADKFRGDSRHHSPNRKGPKNGKGGDLAVHGSALIHTEGGMGRGWEEVLVGCEANCFMGGADDSEASRRDQEGAGERARSWKEVEENQGSGRIRGIPRDTWRIVDSSLSVWVCLVCIVASAQMSISANAGSLPEGPRRALPLRGGGIGMGMPKIFGSAIGGDVGTGAPASARPRMPGLAFPEEPSFMPRSVRAVPPTPPLDSDLEKSAVRRNNSPPVFTSPTPTSPASFRGSVSTNPPSPRTADRAGGPDLQKELGMMAEEWVKSRGSRTGNQPVEELQQEIDSLIERWTAAAVASPEKAMTTAEKEGLAGFTADQQPKSPSFEVPTAKKKFVSMAELSEGYNESARLLDAMLQAADAREGILGTSKAEKSFAGSSSSDAKDDRNGGYGEAVRDRAGEGVDWSMYNWVESEAIMLSSHKALDELSDRLDASGLAEMWVDPDGDCFFVALVQQLARQPSIRASLEAKGYDFEGTHEQLADGLVLGRYPAASHKCRTDLASYMSSHQESLLGIPPGSQRAYLAAIEKPGTWCGMREVQAAAVLFGIEIVCYEVSHNGLQELHSLPPGQPLAVLRLVKCGSHFWSVIPQPQAAQTPPELPSPRDVEMLHHQMDDGDLPDSTAASPRSAPPPPSSLEPDKKPRGSTIAPTAGYSKQEPVVQDTTGSGTLYSSAKHQPPASDVSEKEEVQSPRQGKVTAQSDSNERSASSGSPGAAQAPKRTPAGRVGEEMKTFSEWQKKLRSVPSVVKAYWQGAPGDAGVHEQDKARARSGRQTFQPTSEDSDMLPSDEDEEGDASVVEATSTPGQRSMAPAGQRRRWPEQAVDESSQGERAMMEEYFRETINLATPRAGNVLRSARKQPSPPAPTPPPPAPDKEDKVDGLGETVGLLLSHMQQMDDKRAEQMLKMQAQQTLQVEKMCEAMVQVGKGAKDSKDAKRKQQGEQDKSGLSQENKKQEAAASTGGDMMRGAGTEAMESKSGVAAEKGHAKSVGGGEGETLVKGPVGNETKVDAERAVHAVESLGAARDAAAAGAEERWIEFEKKMQERMLAMQQHQEKMLTMQMEQMKGLATQAGGGKAGKPQQQVKEPGRGRPAGVGSGESDSRITAHLLAAIPGEPAAPAAGQQAWPPAPPAAASAFWSQQPPHATYLQQLDGRESRGWVRQRFSDGREWTDPLLGKTLQMQRAATEATERVRRTQAELDAVMEEAARKKANAELLQGALEEVQAIRQRMAETSEQMSELHRREQDFAHQLRRGVLPSSSVRTGAEAWRLNGAGGREREAGRKDVKRAGGWTTSVGSLSRDSSPIRELAGKIQTAEENNKRLEERLRQAEALLASRQEQAQALEQQGNVDPVRKRFQGADASTRAGVGAVGGDVGPSVDDYGPRNGEWGRDGGIGGRGRGVGMRVGWPAVQRSDSHAPGASARDENAWDRGAAFDDDEASLTRKIEVAVPMPMRAAADRPPERSVGQRYSGQGSAWYEPAPKGFDMRGGMAGRNAFGMRAARVVRDDVGAQAGLVGGRDLGARGGLEMEDADKVGQRSFRFSSAPSDFDKVWRHGGKKRKGGRVLGGSTGAREVEEILAEVGLSGYEEVLLRNGWDTPQRLRLITEDDLIDLGVKKGHARVMVDSIAALFNDS